MRVYWEATKECKRNCSYCFARHSTVRPERRMAAASSIVKFLKDYNPKSVVITGGEPFLRPDLSEILLCLASFERAPEVRILTAGPPDPNELLNFCRKHLIHGVTFSDHSADGRKDRLDLVREINSQVSVNTILPIHRGRISDARSVAAAYMHAGCRFVSLNLIVFEFWNDSRSMIHAKTDEISELYSLAKSGVGQDQTNFVSMQMAFLFPKRIITNQCHAGQDFIFLDAGLNIYPCPYLVSNRNRIANQKNIEPDSNKKYWGLSQRICDVHAGCICMNPNSTWIQEVS
jgi:MoaA/NifB/PqqE/SkfB family radical SAM enzyme